MGTSRGERAREPYDRTPPMREPALPSPPRTRAWHATDPEQVAADVGTDLERGLPDPEAADRLRTDGENRLPLRTRDTAATLWLRQVKDPLTLLLLAAAALSLFVGHPTDMLTILAIVVLNGVLGFTQEWRAERALAALAEMLTPRCRVRRGGHDVEIPSTRVVRGDLVLLGAGDRVPADVRLSATVDLAVDESALTGESVPVGKRHVPVPEDADLAARASMAWMGTHVVRGSGEGVVVATGLATEFGVVARLTAQVPREPTPLQRRLARLGRRLGTVAVGIAALVALLGVVLGRDLLEMLFTGVSLAVAIVPEGLPAVVTITLALGVRQMARRRALVRRLSAAETLGGATVICCDKTGTLTRAEMTVQRIWTRHGEVQVTGAGYEPQGAFEVGGRTIDPAGRADLMALLRTAALCNHARVRKDDSGAWTLVGEPTEGALRTLALKAGVECLPPPGAVEFPFDSTRKRMTVVEDVGGRLRLHVKGAPDVLLPRATRVLEDGHERPLGEEERAAIADVNAALAREGLRTLALARRDVSGGEAPDADRLERDLTLLGIVGLIDPPRPEAPAAVREAQAAGIRVLMITGDAAETALAVAGQVGLGATRALTGREIEAMDDAELDRALAQPVCLARTSPQHKLRVVAVLQARGDVVAMTGDGVNDAPALKKADIGVAMGRRGTEVARAASDMVLTDDNFATIVAAVEEGRRQDANLGRFVRYLLSSNTGEVIAILASVLVGGPLILLPVQILWMNLVTDGLTALTLGLEPLAEGAMRRPPRRVGAGPLEDGAWRTVVSLGAAIGAVGLALFYVLGAGMHPARAQTLAFCGLIVAEKVNVLNFRGLGLPMRRIGYFSNPWLIAALALAVLLQVAAVYVPFLGDALHTVPLEATDWLWVVGLSLPVFLVPEALRAWRNRASHP